MDWMDQGVKVRSAQRGYDLCDSAVHEGDAPAVASVLVGVEEPDSGKEVWVKACPGCWADAVVKGLGLAQFQVTGRTLVLYHRTSTSGAEAIAKLGRFHSREGDEVWFSNRESGQNIVDYGEASVRVEVPEVWAELDDEFTDGERHYRVKARDIERAWITGVMLPARAEEGAANAADN